MSVIEHFSEELTKLALANTGVVPKIPLSRMGITGRSGTGVRVKSVVPKLRPVKTRVSTAVRPKSVPTLTNRGSRVVPNQSTQVPSATRSGTQLA